MHPRVLVIVTALSATLPLVAALPFAEAQVSPKECKKTCKTQKDTCEKNFKAQAQDAKQTCRTNYKAAKPLCGRDKGCKKSTKQEFQSCKHDAEKISAKMKSCVKDAMGFKTCKTCCKGEDRGSCPIVICGDGQAIGPEECDNGAGNSDTTPDACRTSCRHASCGDGVQDTGEGCDAGENNSDTTPDACRSTCEPPTCGDGMTDKDEGCDAGENNSDTTPGACRTTCEPPHCGDGVTDPGPPNNEECDGNDEVCASGKCRNDCSCKPITCPDNQIDPGEECDGTSDSACACRGSCLDCLCFDDFTRLAFTTVTPGGNCGRINDDPAGTGKDLVPFGATKAQLDCGTLYIGGGQSAQPPSPTPDGATSIFNMACGDPRALVLSATTSTDTGSNQTCTDVGCFFGPPLPIPNADSPAVSTCVINAIAGRCLGGSSNGRVCTIDRDCSVCQGGSASGRSCTDDNNCSGGVCQQDGTCTSRFAGGVLDAVTGASTITLPLKVSVRVTADLQPESGIQPCPTCTEGTCDSGENSGGACTTTTSLLTSHDCLPTEAPLAPFLVDLSPLGTGTATKTAAVGDGIFCTPQKNPGAFGQPPANFIQTIGKPAGDLTGGDSLGATQASVFCIPKTGSGVVDNVASLPGPGAVTLKGSSQLLR